MNLWLRLLWLLSTASTRPAPPALTDATRLLFRVWPHDLDPILHMNNGRYLTIMDLGRIDAMLRTGMWRAVRRHGWMPVASAIKIRFRRELKLFQRFALETRVVAWDETTAVIEQRFVIEGGERDGQIAAHALFKGGFYDKTARSFVPIARIMSEIGYKGESPPISEDVAAFLAADQAMKDQVPQRATAS